jgi:protein-L-isoaspartate(D-aspartate) O-methyltransferase
MALIDSLIREGWLRTPRIIEAFQKIKRVDFLPEDMKDLANLNEALPIGDGQTISQPLVVAFMLELLEPQEGEKILDIGAGSGWTSALLAHIVSGGELNEKLKMKNEKLKGKIVAVEIIPELAEFGKRNVEKYNFIEKGIVKFILGDGSMGYQEEAPFDKILASASVQKELPLAWKEQLKIGGRIVTPIGSSIWLIIKESEKSFKEVEYPGFVFVPLIEES